MNDRNDALYDYAERHTTPEDPLLAELTRHTHLHVMNPRMLSGAVQGQLLTQIAYMLRPQSVLEIGTYTGYSALCLAKGLAEGGRVHSIERNDELRETAHAFVLRSALADKITLYTGDARTLVPAMPETFDLIYIDGDKCEYGDYYRVVFDKWRRGGFMLVDNVLWDGKVVACPEATAGRTGGIAAFNDCVQADERVENVLLPFRDGLMIIRKR
jgi:predicted O-methyltransferase YrrM